MDEIPVADVLSDLSEQIGESLGACERVQIRQVNPALYVCRVYLDASDEYEAYHVGAVPGTE